MKNTTTLKALLVIAALGMAPAAEAQLLWNPLDTKPSPNAIVAFDTSVTMLINVNCTNCHRDGLSANNTRLIQARNELRDVAVSFKDLFVWGGYTYRGCGSAQIRRRRFPDAANKQQSYDNLFGPAGIMTTIWNDACGSSEGSWPNGSAAIGTCLTDGCLNDQATLTALRQNPPAGLNLPDLQPAVGNSTTCSTRCTSTGTTTPPNCTPPPFATFNPSVELLNAMAQAPAFEWPKFDTTNAISTNEIRDQLCIPLQAKIDQVKDRLDQCLIAPTAYWDLSAFAGGWGTWCNPGQLSASICDTGSVLRNSCVCDSQNQPGCFNGGFHLSDCGIPLTFRARQAVAVCESWNPAPGRMGEALRNQSDNKLNAVAGGCRENMIMYVTDGAFADGLSVYAHALGALDGGNVWVPGLGNYPIAGSGTYISVEDPSITNAFVFYIANSFSGSAHTMQRWLSKWTIPNAYAATNPTTMASAFAEISNRVLKGTYSGSNMTVERYGRYAAIHSFSVFGIPDPLLPPGVVPTQRYLGHPSRLSLYPLNPITGAIIPNPICETDWATKLAINGGSPLFNPPGFNNYDTANLGGPASFAGSYGNGVSRIFDVPGGGAYMDRNGDGTPDVAPAASGGFRLGAMVGGTNTSPVLVEPPQEIPMGASAAAWSTYQQSLQNRPLMMYTWSNGYLHAFKALNSTFNANPFGFTTDTGVKLQTNYGGDNNSCVEYWRFRPSWVNAAAVTYTYNFNNLVQQPITTGQLVAREVQVAMSIPPQATDYATVVVGAQGKGGSGMIALDVTDPEAPTVLRQWSLPLVAGVISHASSEPMIYQVPLTNGASRPAVIMSSGEDGRPAIFVSGFTAGAMTDLQQPIALAAGDDFPTSPVCLDVRGRGAVTHCYLLSRRGRLVRIALNPGATLAQPVVDNANVWSVPGYPGSGHYFYARPTIFFDSFNNVNIAFGSGNVKNLAAPNGPTNYFWVLKDEFERKATGGSATDANVCAPSINAGSGRLAIGAGQHIVSPATISKGVLAWTAYEPGNDGCQSGDAFLYAMNFETCSDAGAAPGVLTPPAGANIGKGIPASPTMLPHAQAILAGTSGKIGAGPGGATLRGGIKTTSQKATRARPLYWRRIMTTK